MYKEMEFQHDDVAGLSSHADKAEHMNMNTNLCDAKNIPRFTT